MKGFLIAFSVVLLLGVGLWFMPINSGCYRPRITEGEFLTTLYEAVVADPSYAKYYEDGKDDVWGGNINILFHPDSTFTIRLILPEEKGGTVWEMGPDRKVLSGRF